MRPALLPAALLPLSLLGCGLAGSAIGTKTQAATQEAHERLGRRPDDPPAADLAPWLADGLSADDAIALALCHGDEVRTILQGLGVDAASWVRSSRLRNPSLHADALFFADGTEIELGLLTPLLDSLQQPLRERVAAHQLDAAQAAATAAIVDVAFDAWRTFLDVLAAEQRARVAAEAATAAGAAADFARALDQAGNASPEMVALVLVAEAEAELAAASAADAVIPAREAMQRRLGLFGADTGWHTVGELGDDALHALDLERIETRVIASSLDLRAQHARLHAAERQAGLTDLASRLPGTEIGITAMRESNGEDALGPALRLELPLFDSGDATRSGTAARAGLEATRHRQLAVHLRSLARQLRDGLRAAARRAEYARTVLVPRSQQAVTRTLERYNAMQVGAFDVVRARQRELAARLQAIDHLHAAWRLRADLGQLLAGAMPKATPWLPPTAAATSHDPMPEKH